MLIIISKKFHNRWLLKFFSAFLIFCLLFNLDPLQVVLADTYEDEFTTAPFAGYVTSFTTGTATTGLRYVCTNCDFGYDNGTINSLSIIYPGAASITITSRNAGTFSFSSIYIDTSFGLNITGTGEEPFSFSVAASGKDTFSPDGGDKLVNQVVISNSDTNTDFSVIFDNVSVSFDSFVLTSFTRQNPSTSPTNADELTFRATFSEGVENVSIDDFSVNGTTTATVSSISNISNSVYDVTVSGGNLANFNGEIGLNLSASNNITSIANHSSLPVGEPATDETYILDNAGPTVNISQASGQSDPATSAPINFTVVFNESVSDFATGDVSLGGTAGATSAIVTGSGTTYNVAVSGMNVDGTVIASINAGSASDSLGNLNTASTSSDNQVTFNGDPEIDIQRPASTSIADGGSDAIGSHALGTVNLTYTVDNSAGTDTLTISNVTASNLNNVSNFSLDTSSPIHVAGGSISTFDISFDIDVNGTFSFDMIVSNNDSTENPYNITVSGTGTGGMPEMDLQRLVGTSIADGGTDGIGDQTIGTVYLTYTVDNSAGTDQLSISNVTASNENNVSGFSLDTATPVTVAAGTSGTFDISFDVGINGAFSLDIDIANNDNNENPYNITISGTGTGGTPEIDIQRPVSTSITDGGSDAIGSQPVGTVNLTYTVDNSAGTDTLTISNVTASNLNNVSNFSLDTSSPIHVAGGSISTFDISFDIDVNGTFSFDMIVSNNDSTENPYNITVSGTGTGGMPEMDLQRLVGTSIADGGTDGIGDQTIGTVYLTYTVDNSAGTDQLSISNVTASNENNVSGFSLDTATPVTVAAGTSGTFDISFDVGINGAFSLDMDIANNDNNENPYNITISGTGTGGTPEIDIQRPASTSITDGGSDAIGSQPVGTVNLTYTVDNSAGTETLTISNVTASNLSNINGFTLDTATPINIAAGSTASFTISFSIPSAGAFSLDMDIVNNDSDESNYDIAISGTGFNEPEIAISYEGVNILDEDTTSSIIEGTDFGQDLVNYAPYSPEHTFTITNSGAGILLLSDSPRVTLTGSGFTLISDAPSSIAPGDSATFTIRFAATIPGANNGTISITNNDNNEDPFNFNITGTGYNGALMIVKGGSPQQDITNGDLNPTNNDGTYFGVVALAGAMVDHTFEINNLGNSDLNLSGSPIVTISGTNAADFTVTSQPTTPVISDSNSTFIIRFDPSAAGSRTALVSISNNDPNCDPFTFSISGDTDDFEVMMSGNTSPVDGATLSTGPDQILVQFSRAAQADGSSNAADYIGNYMLVEDGADNSFNTVSCLLGPTGDDTPVSISAASYNNANFTATLTVTSTDFIAGGRYRLLVCGTTSIKDTLGNELNGGGSDTQVTFLISASAEETETATNLPITGFPFGRTTILPDQPDDKKYTGSTMMLEIPALSVKLPIFGVPLVDGSWDVSWLGYEAGYLEGSAYPTWNGNTVITAHVWDALNQPGPFIRLKELQYGDLIKIYSGNNIYVYEVQDTRLYTANSITAVMRHEDLDWVTLITCENYQKNNGTYSSRRVVRAVLVQVITK